MRYTPVLCTLGGVVLGLLLRGAAVSPCVCDPPPAPTPCPPAPRTARDEEARVRALTTVTPRDASPMRGAGAGLQSIGIDPELLRDADSVAASLEGLPWPLRRPARRNRHHRKKDSPLWVVWHRLLLVLVRTRRLPVPGWSLGKRGSNSTHPVRVLLPKALKAASAVLPNRKLRCVEWGDFYKNTIPQCAGPQGHVIAYQKGGCGSNPVFGPVFCMDLNGPATHVPSGHFDVIIATQVFEHIRRPFRAIRTLKRILAPGGFVMMSVPFVGDPYHDRPWDYFRYTERGLAAIFRGTGMCLSYGPVKMGGMATALGGLLGAHSTDLPDEELSLPAPSSDDFWYATFVTVQKPLQAKGCGGRPEYGRDIDQHSGDVMREDGDEGSE